MQLRTLGLIGITSTSAHRQSGGCGAITPPDCIYTTNSWFNTTAGARLPLLATVYRFAGASRDTYCFAGLASICAPIRPDYGCGQTNGVRPISPIQLEKYLIAVGGIFRSGGKHKRVVKVNGRPIALSYWGDRVPDYLIKQIAGALGLTRRELVERVFAC